MSDTPKAAEPAKAALVVPDYLKAMQGASQQNAGVDSMASAAMSIPRISMRGKKFRFVEGGEEVATANDFVELVIFGVEPDALRFIKTFYANPYGGANANNPPDCSSDDGVRPAGWVSRPQHNNCAECPKNRFGSAMSRNNKPSKACRDSKRLWVGRHDDVLKSEKATMYALGVPVTSLKSLAEFGRSLKQMNVPITAAVVKVVMDDDSEFPMISFELTGFLAEEQAKLAIARSEKAEWKANYVSGPALSAPVPNVALPGQPAATTGGNGSTAAGPSQPPTDAPPKKANMDDIIKQW